MGAGSGEKQTQEETEPGDERIFVPHFFPSFVSRWFLLLVLILFHFTFTFTFTFSCPIPWAFSVSVWIILLRLRFCRQ